MKNRHTNIRFALLSTGILMLVLSVLPHHHHHDGSIRLSIPESCSECTQDNAHEHQHSEGERCDLRELFVLVSRDDSNADHLFAPPAPDSTMQGVACTLPPAINYTSEIPYDALSVSYGDSAVPILHALHAAPSPLRAPPAFLA